MKLLVEHVFKILGAQVRRVRVEGPGQAGEVNFEELVGIELVEHPVAIPIAHRDLTKRLGLVGLVGPKLKQVKLDALPPPLVGFLLINRVIDLLRVIRQIFINVEIELLLEQLLNGLVPLIVAHEKPLEDPAGEVDVALADLVVKVRGFLLELLDVGFQEIVLLGVEILEEVVAPLDGDLVVDHGPSHVPPFDEIDHGLGRFLVLIGRNRCLSSHNHRHEGQDGDQRQGS